MVASKLPMNRGTRLAPVADNLKLSSGHEMSTANVSRSSVGPHDRPHLPTLACSTVLAKVKRIDSSPKELPLCFGSMVIATIRTDCSVDSNLPPSNPRNSEALTSDQGRFQLDHLSFQIIAPIGPRGAYSFHRTTPIPSR